MTETHEPAPAPVAQEMPDSLRKALGLNIRADLDGFDDGIGPNEQEVLRDGAEHLVPAVLACLEIGDRKFYNLEEMSVGDRLRYQSVCRARVKDTMRPALSTALRAIKELRTESEDADEPLYDEADLKILLDTALSYQATSLDKSGGRPEPTAQQIGQFASSIDGVRELLLVILKNEKPVVNMEWLVKNFTEANYEAVVEAIKPLTTGKHNSK